jgi:hypothetical protein
MEFDEHDELISTICDCRYPKWMQDAVWLQPGQPIDYTADHVISVRQGSPVWDQLRAKNVDDYQDGVFLQALSLVSRACVGKQAESTEEETRLTQLVSELVDLATDAQRQEILQIGLEPRTNSWPDAYSAFLYSFVFGRPKGALPPGLTVG